MKKKNKPETADVDAREVIGVAGALPDFGETELNPAKLALASTGLSTIIF